MGSLRHRHHCALLEYIHGKLSLKELLPLLKTFAKSNMIISNEDIDKKDPSSSPSHHDGALISLNIASALMTFNQNEGANKMLEKLWKTIEPQEDIIAIRICFMLLDMVVCAVQGNSMEPSEGVIKMQSILAYLGKPKLSFRSRMDPDNEAVVHDVRSAVYLDDTTLDSPELQYRLSIYKVRMALMEEASEGNLQLVEDALKKSIFCFNSKLKKRAEEAPLVEWGPPITTDSAITLHVMLLAQKLYNGKRFVEARKALSSCSRKFKGMESSFLNNQGCIHHQLRQPHLATSSFVRALKGCCKDHALECDLLYNSGLELFKQRKYQLAYRCFYGASRKYKHHAPLWLRLGECCMELLGPSTKKHALVESSNGVGKLRRLYLSLPTKQYTQGRSELATSEPSWTMALKCFRTVLLLTCRQSTTMEKTYYTRSQLQLASVCLTLRDPDSALRAASYILKMDDVSPSMTACARMYAAEALVMQEQPQEAQEMLSKVTAGVDAIDVAVNRATLHLLQHRETEATRSAQEAIQHDPTSSSARQLMVYLHLRNHRAEEALSIVTRQ